MSEAFSITTASGMVDLDANRQGSVSFSVSNVSGRAIRARADVVAEAVAAPSPAPEPVAAGARERRRDSSTPSPPPTAGWFAIEGAAERSFQVGATEVYRVDVTVPGTAAPPPEEPPRNYRFRLDLLGTENPDEDQAQGQWVQFAVRPQAAPRRRFPWWWLLVAAGALVVIVGVVVTVVLLSHRQGTLTPSANTVNFGIVAVAQTTTKQVTIKNNGQVATTVNTTISGANAGDFSIASSACAGQTLNPNATCVLNVTFTPPATGSDVASLQITGNHATASTVALTGSGGAPAASASPNPFTLQLVKQDDAGQVWRGSTTITNTGSTPLQITGASAALSTGGNATVQNGCGQPVAPNQHCSISVQAPASGPTPQGTLTVNSNAAGSPLRIPFT